MLLDQIQNTMYTLPITFISTTAIICFSVVLYLLIKACRTKGPWGVPYLGLWPFLEHDTCHLQLMDYMKKYGPVYTFTFTGRQYIHLGTIKALKEAHVNKADCFSQRYTDFGIITLIFGEGVGCANGEKWRVLRKFFVQSFREFGLTSAKEMGSGATCDAMYKLLEDLRKSDGTPVNLVDIFTVRCCGIMNRMLFNEDGISEEELLAINRAYSNLLMTFTGTRILLMGQFAKRIILPLTQGYSSAVESHNKIDETLRAVIRRHEENFNESNIRDIIDSYIKERYDRKKRGDPTAAYFTENSLLSSLLQFVGDGILGVSIFLCFFVYQLLNNPEEQEKIYSELVNVTGTNREVTLEDRSNLPYLNAFIQEVIRTSDFFVIFPSLECTKETEVNGMTVPKGSITMMNIYAAQHDPEVYKNPEEFNPSRYLDTDGRKKEPAPVSFGIGKRSCAGEGFTMMTSFLFLSAIVKNFRLTSPTENVSKKEFLEGKLNVCAHPRTSK